MNLSNHAASIFVPDGLSPTDAFGRVTHLGIGAHQDDLEIMAFHGIKHCFRTDQQWFGGVTCTSGGGSPRVQQYKDLTDEQMADVRRKEQDKAAHIGEYGFMAQLGYESGDVRQTENSDLIGDLENIFTLCNPSVVYTHNPADKHPTHVGVTLAVIAALRRLEPGNRPEMVYGCEVWRNLDWLPDNRKVVLDVSGADNLAAALIGVHDSQITGGKRYDLATFGRRHSNATFFDSTHTDTADQLCYAMDLSPLIQNDGLDIVDYISTFMEEMKNEIISNLS